MRARQGGGRAHHCATSFMLTLISFITFATQWALPSRPSSAWGARRLRRELPGCAPAAPGDPPILPVRIHPLSCCLQTCCPRCSCHSFYKRSCGEREREPVSFPLNSYVPTPTRVVKGRRISAKGESIALIEFENTEGASSLCRTNKDFPQGNSRDDTFDLPARASEDVEIHFSHGPKKKESRSLNPLSFVGVQKEHATHSLTGRLGF